MSALRLRRDHSSEDASNDRDTRGASKDVRAYDVPVTRPQQPAPKSANAQARRSQPRPAPKKSFADKARGWAIMGGVLAALLGYPSMIVVASDVGDVTSDQSVDRTQWTAAWAGASVQLMQRHYDELGWAADAADWAPMARLAAKPAYQSAMAAALGDLVTLKSNRIVAETGKADPDLLAASRLLSQRSTGIQMRAAADALTNYDRRLRRRGATVDASVKNRVEELKLAQTWLADSQTQLSTVAQRASSNVFDRSAAEAVYAAKGRAEVARDLIASMQWTGSKEAEAARATALEAWRDVAVFHPLFVMNGSPGGSLLGNHAASMGFLLAKAEAATTTFSAALSRTPASVPGGVANVAPAPGPGEITVNTMSAKIVR